MALHRSIRLYTVRLRKRVKVSGKGLAEFNRMLPNWIGSALVGGCGHDGFDYYFDRPTTVIGIRKKVIDEHCFGIKYCLSFQAI